MFSSVASIITMLFGYFSKNSTGACRDIALRYTARALARVVLITSLISANQILCMRITFRKN